MSRFRFEVTLNEHGGRLDKVLARRLAVELEGGFSRNKTKKLLDAGKVRHNGDVERFGSTELEYDDILEVEVDFEIVGSPKSHDEVSLGEERILFEDDVVVAVDKPAGLPTQPTRDPNRDHLVAALERRLRDRGVDDPYVATHHRLDVGTTGVVMVAVDNRANKGLAEAFQHREARKTYRALARAEEGEKRGESDSWTVENLLAEERRGGRTRQVAVETGGDRARTDFEIQERRGRLVDVRARPETGRRHQIRAHLAQSGLPIVGDDRYGGVQRVAGRSVDRPMLHARRLRLPHPVENFEVDVTSPIPDDFREVWNRGED